MRVDRNLEQIAIACARECVRQDVGLERVGRLLLAYDYAALHAEHGELPQVQHACHLAELLEPDSGGGFRRTPVTFAGGGTAAPPSTVENATTRLFQHVQDADPAEFVRAFLSIHPFTDGNGRTAFVLFNWLRGSLEDPVPLPEFDFS